MQRRAGPSDDSRRRKTRAGTPPRVLVFTACIAATALALSLTVVRDAPTVDAPWHLPWWALAIGFAAAEVWVMHLQIRREIHSISLSEVVLTLGLFFTSPIGLVVAYVVGGGGALWLHRKQPTLKLVFNVSQFALNACVATMFFAIAMSLDTFEMGPMAWLAAVAASVTSATTGAIAVSLIIALHERTVRFEHLRPILASGVAIGAVNAGVGVLAATLLWTDGRSAWPLIAVAAVLVAGYRGYASLRRRHESLELLYEFTKVVGRSARGEDVVTSVLSHARVLLHADAAALLFDTDGEGAPAHVAVLGSGQLLEQYELFEIHPAIQRVIASNRPIVVPRNARRDDPRSLIPGCGWRDAVVSPITAENGMRGVMIVADRLGDASTFDSEDARLLETIANHASVALDNGRLVDRLRHDALHDALTGLANRTLFHDRVEHAIEERGDRLVAVLLMDLDRFKEINDSLGHHNGDVLLQEIGKRLSAWLPEGATVARLGGDEFSVVATVDDVDQAIALAEAVRRVVDEPCRRGELLLEVGATIGIAVAPDHGGDAVILVQRADVAMYAAKASQAGTLVYSADIDEYGPRRLALTNDLRNAIATGELEVHYQPKAFVPSGDVVGVEALARWFHPTEGPVPPDEFIPIAERSGLIGELTKFVLQESLRECRAWRERGWSLSVAVNISTRTLLDPDLPSDITRLLRDARVPSSALILEITESSVMSDPDRAVATLAKLRMMGVSIAVDDFGTGYSSLSYLKRLPVDEVKIDKSFVQTMTRDHSDAKIVRSIIDLGHNLGLTVVAEGVEDVHTWHRLAEFGCTQAQGYYLSRAIPADELAMWLEGRERSLAHRDAV